MQILTNLVLRLFRGKFPLEYILSWWGLICYMVLSMISMMIIMILLMIIVIIIINYYGVIMINISILRTYYQKVL